MTLHLRCKGALGAVVCCQGQGSQGEGIGHAAAFLEIVSRVQKLEKEHACNFNRHGDSCTVCFEVCSRAAWM